jgi:TRAP-type mannitol/chloroaromatic compound transport system substrate-binding protein
VRSAAVGLAGSGTPRRLSFDDLPSAGATEEAQKSQSRSLVVAAVMAGALALSGLGYWIGVAAPARDEAAWLAAASADTDVAYQRYIAEQPSGRHVAEARQRREALAQQAAHAGGVVLSGDTPLRQAPASPQLERAPEEGEAPAQPAQPAVPATPDNSSKQARATLPQASAEPSAPRVAPPPPAFQPRAALPDPTPDAEIARLAQAAPAAQWRMATTVFANDKIAGFTDQPADFVSELERLSGGKLALTPLTGEAVIPRGELLQRLRGDRDLFAWRAPLVESGRHIEFALFAGAVPFGLGPADHVRWLRGEGARLLEQAHIDIGAPLRVIPCGIAGGVGAWFRREIRSPSEFRGLKVRGPQLMTRALARLEAEVVTLQSNRELTAAFNENRLDANFGVTPLTGIFLSQPHIATVYNYPGIHAPAYLFELLVGPETWVGLAEAQRRLVDEACRRNLDRWAQGFPSSQNEVLNRIRTQRIVVRPFIGPVREAIKKAVDETLAEEAAKSPRFKEILDSYNRYRR